MVDFSFTMWQWFAEEFRDLGLTLSAGLELMEPKRPMNFVVVRAGSLLEAAKDAGKDRRRRLTKYGNGEITKP